jgi:hypothetical protein
LALVELETAARAFKVFFLLLLPMAVMALRLQMATVLLAVVVAVVVQE